MLSPSSKHRLKRALQILMIGILLFVLVEGVLMRFTF